MSPKRILPALILAGSFGFLGLHRLYAGRYVTGLLQLALFTPGAIMLWHDLAGLAALRTMDDIQNWILTNQVRPLPVLLVAIPTFWAVFDCVVLLSRRFTDGAGEKMTRWI
jgi:TM2 domain-containing membrane protein YozV